MKYMGLNEIREAFLKFFEGKDHLVLPSSSLVPHNDNSLLLINSGMAPLKPYFTGQVTPPSLRVATCQKCIRTGDIENVGKTARHGTFFEMLGNFSFGDYFKNEIIPWSWEFVTVTLRIPEDRLYATVYIDDDEAYEIWNKKVGLPKDRITRLGKADNFWEHGLGPCGPCSEIYYDRGEKYGCKKPDCKVGCDCDRYMEFWNLVFTQFNKEEDGSYTDLSQKNIDTGMGLERMATIMQGVDSIFDVDTVKAVRDKVCEIAGVRYNEDFKKDVSIRVITDHVRSVVFMTSDGVLPSNEGRGYVLRRLLRRAARHGRLLGIEREFMPELGEVAIEQSKDAYPQLEEKRDYILKIIAVEENSFYKTIDKGMEILKDNIAEMKARGEKVMNGEMSFKLYDTYGFPVDLTREILEEEGMSLDEDAFMSEMKVQKERARKARGESTYMGADETVYHRLDTSLETHFVGYSAYEISDAKVLALVVNGEVSDTAAAGDEVSVFLDNTPFYAESGGQTGDKGIIYSASGKAVISDCVKVVGGKTAHIGSVTEGSLSVGDTVSAEIDKKLRLATTRNHSATHLLQKALRAVLGTHVEQAGSLVTPERLRFDFTHFTAMTDSEIKEVERLVNEKIFENLEIKISEKTIDESRKMGAMALFGEKYGDVVRVVDMGGYSIELCGGAHLGNTSQIGLFKIVSEGGIAAGVRRIEALTGENTLKFYQSMEEDFKKVCSIIKATPETFIKRAEDIVLKEKELSRELESLKAKLAKGSVTDMLKDAEDIKGVRFIAARVNGADMGALRTMGDEIKAAVKNGVIVLAGEKDGKVSLLAMAADEAVSMGAHAGEIIKSAAAACGGSGGGRPNMAQAGGKDMSKIDEALNAARQTLTGQLK